MPKSKIKLITEIDETNFRQNDRCRIFAYSLNFDSHIIPALDFAMAEGFVQMSERGGDVVHDARAANILRAHHSLRLAWQFGRVVPDALVQTENSRRHLCRKFSHCRKHVRK